MQQVVAHLPETSRVAIECLAVCESRTAELIGENLRRRLPFLRPCFGPPRGTGKSEYSYFDNLRKELEAFLGVMRELIVDFSSGGRENILRRIASFPGISVELNKVVGDLWGDQARQCLCKYQQRAEKTMVERQFMIFPSYRCNLNCEYCFAKGLPSTEMSFERVMEIIDWSLEEGAQKLTFCGGEPTVYPHFSKVLEGLRDRGVTTYFATNLLGSDQVIDSLRTDVVESLIVHVTQKKAYTEQQWQRLASNLAKLHARVMTQGFRINMHRLDCSYEHIFQLAEQIGLKEIQFALTFPAATFDNSYVKIEQFKTFIPAVIDLMRKCEDADYRFLFSKPLPLCLFGPELGNEMIRKVEYPPTCSVFLDGFTHNACVSPWGDVSPCLALMDIKKSISEFESWDDLSLFCREKLVPLLDAALFDHCQDCFLFERRLCQGSCLGHKHLEV